MASDRKGTRYQWKIGFLMIHFTKWDIWVLRMIQSSGWVNFSMKWGCWGHWGHRGCCGRWGHWCCRGYKAWQIATEDFSVIQVLKLVLIWCFEKRKKNGVQSGNIMLNFSTLSVGGYWGQPMLLFWKPVSETQISEPPEPTRHHNSIKLWIILPLRADLLCTLQYEIPCSFSLNLDIFGHLLN